MNRHDGNQTYDPLFRGWPPYFCAIACKFYSYCIVRMFKSFLLKWNPMDPMHLIQMSSVLYALIFGQTFGFLLVFDASSC